MSKVCLQFGCGLSTHPNWLNYDRSPRLFFENSLVFPLLSFCGLKRLFPKDAKYGDIVKGLPISKGSIDLIYSSHVLEHMSQQDAMIALRNCFELLKPGGKLKIVVPDLFCRVEKYYNDAGHSEAADGFLIDTLLGTEVYDRSFRGLVSRALGSSEHLWMYDVASLTQKLQAVGFTSVARSGYLNSGDPEFEQVEEESRFFDGEYQELSLEAVK